MALTGPVLADCLTGAADPLKILFGNPKAQQVLDDFYHESPMLATMTDQLVAFIKQAITQISSDVNIRIIEVGAGFGGTTLPLLRCCRRAFAVLSTLLPSKTIIRSMLVRYYPHHIYPFHSETNFRNLSDHKEGMSTWEYLESHPRW